METNHKDQWVNAQLAAIEPEWHPDALRARHLLSARLHPQARTWTRKMTIAAVTVAVCLTVLALPRTRALAQGLWEHFVLNRVDVVRLDLSDSPLLAHVTTNGVTQSARDTDEAEHMAGFRPNLPAGVISATPRLTVTGPMIAEQTIRVNDLRSALAMHGANDVRVPEEWEGVTARAVIGPMVMADYPGEVQIVQSRPFSLSLPAGFPLEALVNALFRGLGVSSRDAESMAKKFAANPAWLIDIPADEVVNLQDLSLVNGPALLAEEYDDNTGAIARETVIRSTTDRIYAVMCPSRDLCVRIAGMLP